MVFERRRREGTGMAIRGSAESAASADALGKPPEELDGDADAELADVLKSASMYGMTTA